GYDFFNGNRFRYMLTPYLDTLREVFFSWPGEVSGRNMNYLREIPKFKEKLTSDLAWCREQGLKLDLLFNGNCYGEEYFSTSLREKVYAILEELRGHDLFPEVVTTTSQFIAKVVKDKYPEIDVRASVNMRIESTQAFEYISDIFDSLYVCRDFQRDMDYLRSFSDWCKAHGKTLCMLVNSACLRFCPVQIYHDNSLCHANGDYHALEVEMQFPMRLCGRVFMKQGNEAELLKMSWIRPEDIQYYAPHVSVMKLATRAVEHPETMIKAYAEGHYEGDLMECIGARQRDFIIDNTAFPDDWVESGIAQRCAMNCTDCGRCADVLSRVMVRRDNVATHKRKSTRRSE
ncbi:MAG: hypothetical protein IJT83_07435, partial [Victivallales bacterium]|nr:hypothetical protein [Victivallales bacterium]